MELKRYCPECKRYVGKKLSVGQTVLMVFLYACFIIPGIIYSVKHTKKCPICGSATKGVQKPTKPVAKAKAAIKDFGSKIKEKSKNLKKKGK